MVYKTTFYHPVKTHYCKHRKLTCLSLTHTFWNIKNSLIFYKACLIRAVNNIHYSPKVNKYLHNIYNCYLAFLSKYCLDTSVMLLRNLYYRLIVLEMFIYKKIPWKFRMHFYSKTVDLMYIIKNNMPIWTQTCIGLQGTFLHSLTAIQKISKVIAWAFEKF